MQALGADIAKLAVMPRSRQDVAALLAVTAEMAELHPQTPVITMSMGAPGQISRVAGGAFRSAATFAAAGSTSALACSALCSVPQDDATSPTAANGIARNSDFATRSSLRIMSCISCVRSRGCVRSAHCSL